MQRPIQTTIFCVITALALLRCEKDDICIKAVTPDLIIRFYQEGSNPEVLVKVNSLAVQGVANDSILLTQTTDSINIPLKTTTDITQYVLTKESVNKNKINSDTITIAYHRKDIFVSRACGYKTVFQLISVGTTTNDPDKWIKNISIIQTNVENETSAHVKIYH